MAPQSFPAAAAASLIREAGAGSVDVEPSKPNKMPQGDKDKYTDKQKRQAEKIEKSEKKEGKSQETAERIAWATVNKQDGGGKKGGSGGKKKK
jgi:hypothetical protein